jgi:hypothetical protein
MDILRNLSGLAYVQWLSPFGGGGPFNDGIRRAKPFPIGQGQVGWLSSSGGGRQEEEPFAQNQDQRAKTQDHFTTVFHLISIALRPYYNRISTTFLPHFYHISTVFLPHFNKHPMQDLK